MLSLHLKHMLEYYFPDEVAFEQLQGKPLNSLRIIQKYNKCEFLNENFVQSIQLAFNGSKSIFLVQLPVTPINIRIEYSTIVSTRVQIGLKKGRRCGVLRSGRVQSSSEAAERLVEEHPSGVVKLISRRNRYKTC